MKLLTEYYKNGYTFKIIKREGNFAIAEGHKGGLKHPNFEVIEIRSHNGLQMGDNWVEPKEFPPSNNEWGNRGWTALNDRHAKELFDKHKK